MSGLLGSVIAIAAATLAAAGTAAAQDRLGQAPLTPATPVGWSFTPTLVFGGAWDTNALLEGVESEPISDYATLINPRGAIDYRGRKTTLTGGYDGAFSIYHQLSGLNSGDQRAAASLQHTLNPQVALFSRYSMSMMPTTEQLELVGVPFVRIGSRVQEIRGGAEVSFTKASSLSGSYDFQTADFQESQLLAAQLKGGHSHGATMGFRHRLSARTTIISDYQLQHAIVDDSVGTFRVQNGTAGLEYIVSEQMKVSGAAGFSKLKISEVDADRLGPAFRFNLTRAFEWTTVDLSYSRSFVPSYGFGGTQQNEEITARARMPLGRRLYTISAVAWRRNEPLNPGELRLRSLWIDAAIGYALQRWIRIEGFYTGTRQQIRRAGGEQNRTQIGFQIVTLKPMRIR
jgi:hypothetical protein